MEKPESTATNNLPSPLNALGLFAVVMALMIIFSPLLHGMGIIPAVLIAEWGFLLLPALIFAAALNLDFAKTFSLKLRHPAVYLGAVIVGLGGSFLANALSRIQSKFLYYSDDFLEMYTEILNMQSKSGFIAAVAVIAVTPAICEEFIFRGFLLKALSQYSHPMSGIVLSSLLFGLFHIHPYQILPTAVLGLVIGILVWKTGSLLSGILAHGVNNFLVVGAVSRTPGMDIRKAIEQDVNWGILGGILFLSALLIIAGSVVIYLVEIFISGYEQRKHTNIR